MDARFEVGDIFEHEGRSAVIAESGCGGGVFDDRAVRSQVAAQNAQTAFGLQRVVQRADDVRVRDLRRFQVLRHSAAGDGQGIAVQQGQQAA